MAKRKEPIKILRCTRCGTEYTKQQGNFAKCQSPMWAGHGGVIPICKTCLDEMYNLYYAELGGRDAAIRRLCMKFDVYFSNKVIDMITGGYKQTFENPFRAYLARSNLAQVEYNSFDDTLREEREAEASATFATVENLEKAKEVGYRVTKAMLDRWGDAWDATTGEYQELENHYKMLTGSIQEWGNAVETIRSLCELAVLKRRALKDKQYDLYQKLGESYAKRYKDAGFKVNQESIDIDSQPFGVMTAIAEGVCPTEYYKDKELYTDFTGLGDYIQRFLVRPFKNLFTGTFEQDPEFTIRDDDS